MAKKNEKSEDQAPQGSTEVAIRKDDSQFAIMTMDKDEMSELLNENLGGEMLSAQDFDKIKVPAGGTISWTVPSVDGEYTTDSLVGIIIHTQTTRARWADEYSGGGTPPDCKSNDGLNGIGDPGGNCLGCTYNAFGDEDSAGIARKECHESRLIFVLLQNETLPIVIKAPSMSLKNARQYLRGLTSKRKKVHSVYTKFTLERDKNKQGKPYSRIVFSKIGDVERPEISQAYAETMRPYIKTAVEHEINRRSDDVEI